MIHFEDATVDLRTVVGAVRLPRPAGAAPHGAAVGRTLKHVFGVEILEARAVGVEAGVTAGGRTGSLIVRADAAIRHRVCATRLEIDVFIIAPQRRRLVGGAVLPAAATASTTRTTPAALAAKTGTEVGPGGGYVAASAWLAVRRSSAFYVVKVARGFGAQRDHTRVGLDCDKETNVAGHHESGNDGVGDDEADGNAPLVEQVVVLLHCTRDIWSATERSTTTKSNSETTY